MEELIRRLIEVVNHSFKEYDEKIDEFSKRLERLENNINKMNQNIEEIKGNSTIIKDDIKYLSEKVEKNQERPVKTNPVILTAGAGTGSGERRAGQSLGYKTADNNPGAARRPQTAISQQPIQSKVVTSNGVMPSAGRQRTVGAGGNLLSALNNSIENYSDKQLREAIVSEYQLVLYSCANQKEILSNGDAVVKFQQVKAMGEANYFLKQQGGEGLLLPVPRPRYEVGWYNIMKKLFTVEGYEPGAVYNKIIVKAAAVMGANMSLKNKGHLVMLK